MNLYFGLVEGLVESQKRILELISQNSKISKQDLSKIIGISETAIDKNILSLKKKNLLERIGPNKGGYWQIKGFVLGHNRLGKDKLGEK
jgi:ATP-dependent DNA helicase RecG